MAHRQGEIDDSDLARLKDMVRRGRDDPFMLRAMVATLVNITEALAFKVEENERRLATLERSVRLMDQRYRQIDHRTKGLVRLK